MPDDIGTIGFIGAGRLAASLSAALIGAGYPVTTVASASSQSGEVLAEALAVRAASPGEVVSTCDLVFLTVPDAQIADLAATLPWRPGQAVVHCSGALGMDALAAATTRGAITGCLHPLQTFPSRSPEPSRFRGIFCGIETTGTPLGGYLEGLVRAVGATPFRLEGVDRRRYHAAAVFMSNHVVALGSAATRLWTLAGLPGDAGREALAPLLLSAANNVANLPLRDALTGPVARGDITTVEGHLAALTDAPDLRELYRALSLELLHLPLPHDAATTAALHRLLDGPEVGP